MKLNAMNYNKIAELLDKAAYNAKACEQISAHTTFDLNAAYAIQSISMSRRYIRGEKLTGLKLGFTSRAKMEQMGVHDMIWGRLTDSMHYASGADLKKDKFIHPRVEPEIAFLVSEKIEKELTLENVKEYVHSVAVAIEVIDSRYENFKFSLEDVVADNCSSSGFVLGEWKPVGTNIQNIPIQININKALAHDGNSNAILGNPWESMVAISRLAVDNGEILKKGSIVLAGAATPASYVNQGDSILASAEGLGNVSLQVI